MQKGRNKPHNTLFTTVKLTDGMRLCDTAQIKKRLYLFQLKNGNQCGQGSAPTDPTFSKYCRYFSFTRMASSLALPPERRNVVT